MKRLLQIFFPIVLLQVLMLSNVSAQPAPCGPNPAMTSTCASACVICDIDGFTGINDLDIQGQIVPDFCTTFQHNMQFIAFIAGTTNLTIRVDVGDCIGGAQSLELGFFESLDCETFSPITMCDTDIQEFTNQTFTNDVPLIVGQHYYMIIDGSNSANCAWTFSVLDGSTAVSPLTTSGVITHVPEVCPGMPVNFETSGDVGAAIFYWSVDGISQGEITQDIDLSFVNEGTYQVCVIAANVCDQAPPSCTTIDVREVGSLNIDQKLCEGDCVEFNNQQFCAGGVFEEIVTLPSGCDSIISINLEFVPENEVFLDVWICDGETFEVGPNNYGTLGVYSDTILTEYLCDSIVNLELLIITCEIVGTSSEIPVICNGTGTGTLIFSIDQGEPPFEFTYTNIADASISGTGMTSLLDNNEIGNIPAGIYRIYVTDSFGNDVVMLQEVTEPSTLRIEFNPSDYGGFNVSCFESDGLPGDDGVLMAMPLGGVPPYQYVWNTGSIQNEISNLSPITYTVTVTDAVGCQQTDSFTLTSPSELTFDAAFIDPDCEGFDSGIVEISNTTGGVGPYTYSLNQNPFTMDSTFTGLLEGNYTANVQDANNCFSSQDGNLVAPDLPDITFSGDVLLPLGDSMMLNPILNQSSIAEIIWTPDDFLSCNDCLNPWTSAVNDIEYTLTIISDQGCSDLESVFVKSEKRRRVFFPNIFSPDGNGVNEIFFLSGGVEIDQVRSLNVFDRWGNIVFDRTNILINDESTGWNGKWNAQYVANGVYTWVAEVDFIDGVSLPYTGNVTVIR